MKSSKTFQDKYVRLDITLPLLDFLTTGLLTSLQLAVHTMTAIQVDEWRRQHNKELVRLRKLRSEYNIVLRKAVLNNNR